METGVTRKDVIHGQGHGPKTAAQDVRAAPET